MTQSDAELARWLEVLDDLTYYELFGLSPAADANAVRAAFHAFSDAFHPDRHVARPAEEREGLAMIFKRGTEAYMVLSQTDLRALYDAQIAATNQAATPKRMNVGLSRPPRGHSMGPPSLGDAVQSTAARPFAQRAEELMAKGDYRQAKLQLVMANHVDPGNEALEAALKDIDAKIKGAT
jgi:DnaJ-class molecular chaperone